MKNPGDRGNDLPSTPASNEISSESFEHEDTSNHAKIPSENSNQEVFKTNSSKLRIGPISNHLILASYFLPETNGNGIFEIFDGNKIQLMTEEKVVVDFKITSNYPATFKLNDEVIESHPTATNESVQWISFYPTEKETNVEININGELHNFSFILIE